MNAKQQHEHTMWKLYVTLGTMDNAKLDYYQDQHAERYERRMARRTARVKRAHQRWLAYANRFQR